MIHAAVSFEGWYKPAWQSYSLMNRDGHVLICYESHVIPMLLDATFKSDVSKVLFLNLLLCFPGNEVLLPRLYSTSVFQYKVLDE